MNNDNTPVFTERQIRDWDGAVTEAQQYVETTIPRSHHDPRWIIGYREETRPGRGHAIDAVWFDGESLVMIRMDVYGYPSVVVASTDCLHNSSNENCACDPCIRVRHSEG